MFESLYNPTSTYWLSDVQSKREGFSEDVCWRIVKLIAVVGPFLRLLAGLRRILLMTEFRAQSGPFSPDADLNWPRHFRQPF